MIEPIHTYATIPPGVRLGRRSLHVCIRRRLWLGLGLGLGLGEGGFG